MTLASFGWFVVHAVWMGAGIGAVMLALLAAVDQRRVRLRHAIGYLGLTAMVVAPLLATIVTLDLFTPPIRVSVTGPIDQTLGLPMVVEWRARIIRGAAIVWLIGLAWFAARVSLEWLRVRSMWRDATASAVNEAVRHLSNDLLIARNVTILQSSSAEVPMVSGWPQSTILLPVATTADLSSSQLRAVLAHEMAHVQRRDYLANLLQLAMDGVLWFHPCARWLSRQIRAEREYCCDDVAVRAGGDPVEYARALATLEEARHDCRLVLAAASGTLLDRIQRVVGRPHSTMPLRRTLALSLIALFIAGTVVTLAMIVPPGVPLDAKLRSRSLAPPGAHVQPSGPTLPRQQRR